MDIDLSTLSLEELKTLRKTVERMIEGWEERKRREALAAAEEAARIHGFNLADLAAGSGRGKRSAKTVRAARFANPDNPAQTWSGRGRRPVWINEALAAGKTLEDLSL